MFLLSSSSSSLFFSPNFNYKPLPSSGKTLPSVFFSSKPFKTLHFSLKNPTLPSLIPLSSLSEPEPEPEPEPYSNPDANSTPVSITDEWGEKTELEAKSEADYPKASDVDPTKDDDEWKEDSVAVGNGIAAQSTDVVVEKDDGIGDLKRCLVDTVHGTNFGFQASPEIRGEVLELVNKLEAVNPTPAPLDATDILNGNWILLYTAFSELLPLLAVGTIPMLKVEKISQEIDASNRSIVNATTLSSPFATFSFSVSATFEVQTSSRIQVEFKEGKLEPPEIKSSIHLPENVDLFGQKINLSPLQQSINPLQEVAANFARNINGRSPLKIPIPGNLSKSWLLFTYLDEDLRVSRGDGGLFVLVKEGSSLLYQ